MRFSVDDFKDIVRTITILLRIFVWVVIVLTFFGLLVTFPMMLDAWKR